MTGTGRCGTVYLARVLTQSGIACGHESVFDTMGLEGVLLRIDGGYQPHLSHCSTSVFDGERWSPVEPYLQDTNQLVADSSYMAAPFLDYPLFAKATIIHVVRHPAKVIDSFHNHLRYFRSPEPSNKFEEFIYRHVPDLRKEMTSVDRAALYYVLWNELIESSNCKKVFYKVETPISQLSHELGVELNSGELPKTINSMKLSYADKFHPSQLTSSIVRDELMKMAKRYGYVLSDLLA